MIKYPAVVRKLTNCPVLNRLTKYENVFPRERRCDENVKEIPQDEISSHVIKQQKYQRRYHFGDRIRPKKWNSDLKWIEEK